VQTKLTLRLEDDLISKAKLLAGKRGKSLSKIVSEYFKFITSKEVEAESELPPIVKSISGILANSSINEDAYKKHLEEKYL